MPDSPSERYRNNWDRAFSSPETEPPDAIETPAKSGSDDPGKQAKGGLISNIPKRQPEKTGKPERIPNKKCNRPNPWLEFAVQALLCLATILAFIAAAV